MVFKKNQLILIIILFFLIAIIFILKFDTYKIYDESINLKGIDHLSTDTVRNDYLNEPLLIKGNFQYECSSCHHLFTTGKLDKSKLPTEHNITVDHGDIKNCNDCHYSDDSDYLIGLDGKVLEFKDSAQLCSNCHAKEFQDWLIGSHGKMSGYWNQDPLKESIFKCIACHGSHKPKFHYDKLFPAPLHPKSKSRKAPHE